MTYLLDTNVVSELRKPRPDPGLQSWLEQVPSQHTFVSVLVVGEIRQGIERLRTRDSTQALALERWLFTVVDGFGERILAIDAVVAEAWGRLNTGARLPFVDGLLAATALVHGLVVVTRDTDPFERVGVPFLDPWTAR